MSKKPWTKQEEELLLQLKKENLQYKTISKVLNRSQDSVRIKYWRIKEENKTEYEAEAKVLVFDIETSLMLLTGFSTGKQYVRENQIVNDFHIISWAAKWLNEDKVFSGVLKPTEAKKGNDKRILKELWKLMDEADIVIGHNVDRFDVKKVNTRFMLNRLGLPRPYKSIDTLKVARKTFSFSSNKLDYLANLLGLQGKMKHEGYDLWLKCLNGDKQALNTMLDYNEQDVIVTENVYHVLKEGHNGVNRPKTGWKHEN